MLSFLVFVSILLLIDSAALACDQHPYYVPAPPLVRNPLYDVLFNRPEPFFIPNYRVSSRVPLTPLYIINDYEIPIEADQDQSVETESRTPARKQSASERGLLSSLAASWATLAANQPSFSFQFPSLPTTTTTTTPAPPLPAPVTTTPVPSTTAAPQPAPPISAVMAGSSCLSNSDSGICTSASTCAHFGGRAASASSCTTSGNVCCINTVSQCGSIVTTNNTYWTSPSPANAGTTCTLTVRLDPTLPEQQANPICQVRLDFDAFSIGQPNTQSVCSTDTFRVGGTSNRIPTICGDNLGQHMYLMAPSTTADLQMIFTLGDGSSIYRYWKMRISLLPCSSTNLAPVDCLQYFTQSTGIVQSFNWKQMSPTASATRQLANQDYNICFRTEQISATTSFTNVASSICVTPCTVTTTVVSPAVTPVSFSLTGDATIGSFQASGAGAGLYNPLCANTDYMIIPGAVDASNSALFNDRFCGNQLNAAGTAQITSSTMCSTRRPFKLIYKTDGSEPTTDVGNNGFCLQFQQRTT